jgi:glutathione-independent formaldehyde dehydrogenase
VTAVKAVVYKDAHSVAVEQVDDPRLEAPTDALVRITTTAICGSDLHMYEGRTVAESGIVFGHENMGIVEEVGSGVTRIKQGDRVSLPFNVACGFCRNCLAGKTAFCLTVNPPYAGGAYGYVGMGPYTGGQAEYLRVPFADFNALVLPPGDEHENDFAMLADIFPTGYHATVLADLNPGETIAVFGAGPVGLMAAYSAMIKGASTVFVVDKVASRLELAEQIGAVPIDFSAGDPVEQITDQTDGVGADKGVDAVGYQATVADGEEQPAVVLNQLVDVVRHTGRLGVVGLYLPRTRAPPTRMRPTAGCSSTSAASSRRGKRWGRGRPTPRPTTPSCGI